MVLTEWRRSGPNRSCVLFREDLYQVAKRDLVSARGMAVLGFIVAMIIVAVVVGPLVWRLVTGWDGVEMRPDNPRDSDASET